MEALTYIPGDRVKSPDARWILAVEDSATDMFLLERVLDKGVNSPHIIQARDGEQALLLLNQLAAGGRESLPDLILIDLNLPRVDGYEVLSRLRALEAFHRIPVVAITSSQADADRKRALSGGADAYFVKPMDVASYRQLPSVMEDARRVRLDRLAS